MRGAAGLLLCATVLYGQTADGVAYFEKNIRPLLASNCYGCHSSKLAKPMKGLMLDTKAGVLRVVIPGKPDDSLLIAAVRGTGDLKMPPGKPLDSAQVDALVEWVRMGAPDPRTDSAATAAPMQSYDWEKAKQHWSFRPVQDPKPPQAPPEWSRSPVDAFIKEKLDEHKL